MSDPAVDGHLPRRCTAPKCTSQVMIEPRAGVMDQHQLASQRAVVWECPGCYAVRKMPWPKGRTDAGL